MKWNQTYFGLLITCLWGSFYLVSCANIIPPGGGPRDTIPPRLIGSMPKDSSLNVTTKNIVITFDEYVELQSASENLVIQPYPTNTPLVDYKLRNITVKLRDSLEKNTTYAINFGSAIKDVNEGNLAKELTFVFSTGNKIDSNHYKGSVVLAESGKIDSTLIVVLHNNTHDTSILKNRPRYFTKLDGLGNFSFRFLPEGVFSAYVVPNDFTKKYDDSTKLFAFLKAPILINKETRNDTLYAFQATKKIEKVAAPSSNNNKGNDRKTAEEKRLRYTANLENGIQDLLIPLQLTFNRKINTWDSTKIVLYDTSFRPITGYTVNLDTSRTKVTLQFPWKEKTGYRIIIGKDAVKDTSGVSLLKADSARFISKREADYGSFRFRFVNIDFSKHPVLQLIQDNRIVESISLTTADYIRKRYRPGDYEIRILLDLNNNGEWDPGNFKTKLQPELVKSFPKKITIRADRDTDQRFVF